jgi:catechol 2,3-dioxygenase-like lactoylglutathione lyase family enzyme
MGAFLVEDFIPLVHVDSVPTSIEFYGRLGFRVESQMDENGNVYWASLASGQARIMLAASSAPILPEEQAIIFYMYSSDVSALRRHLLAEGLADGGVYCGQMGPNNGRSVVFAESHPGYMPGGEIRVADPDGYCILIGQRTGE